MESKSIKLSATVMIIAVACALLGAGTLSYFSDTETSRANTFQAATLDLKVDDKDDPNIFSFEITDFKPGQCRTHTFALKNTGCIPGVASLTFKNLVQMENSIIEPEAEAGDTTPDGELAEQTLIIIWIDEDYNGYFDCGDKIIWIGYVANSVHIDLLDPDNSPFLCHPVPIDADQTKHLVIWFWFVPDAKSLTKCPEPILEHCYLPPADNNLAQSDSFTVDIEFDLEQAPAPPPKWQQIMEGGFGDPMNNYAWSMAYFKGDLYVGTGRNIPYSVGLALKTAGIISEEYVLEYITHPRGEPGDPEWAEDMRGEIWRYHRGEWSMVHKATTFGTYPEGVGYRIMTTFNGAIYAGVGAGFGPILLMMSTDGENWLPVNTAKIPYPGDTRALAVHNGKLYVGTSGGILGDGVGEIYASDNPQPYPGPDTWQKIAGEEIFGEDNTAVVSLISFNGYLYATTQNINGFEVWRSIANDPTDEWTCVVSGGAGDAWNVWGGTTETFNDQLYVGSMSLPIPPMGPKGFDLIRIYTNDAWDLIVGSYIPRDPTPPIPRGPPLSGWPAGFGNLLNFYCWSLQVYNGYLYLGSFDASVFLRYLPPDLIASLLDEGEYDTDDLAELTEKFVENFGGGDLWKSPDGIHWTPVTLNGFNNPHNYGIRTVLSTPDGLYVGTANPFEGCEIWRKTDE